MVRVINSVLAIALVLALFASSAAAQSVELRLRDGSRWRGQVNDQIEARFLQGGVEVLITGTLVKAEKSYLVIKGAIGGVQREKTIFHSDLVSLKSIGGASTPAATDSSAPGSGVGSGATASDPGSPTAAAPSTEKPLGVIVLPMVGPVGETFRHQEILKVAKKADEYGRGQIIVLLFDSGGGGIEMEKVHQTILEVRKRHRVVAWIKQAISAAAAAASACEEIYFMREGTLGAMTGYAGTQSLQGYQLAAWMENAGKWFEAGGHHRFIAWAMIEDQQELSYDKNPVIGEVTWYNDLSGQHVLSRRGQNLVFTADTALACGFSDGTASTDEELASLLHLPKWHELTDYGRKTAAEWKRTCEQAERDIPLLLERLNYAGTGTGDRQAILGKQISLLQELARWIDRCPNIAERRLDKAQIERAIEERRRQLAEMRQR